MVIQGRQIQVKQGFNIQMMHLTLPQLASRWSALARRQELPPEHNLRSAARGCMAGSRRYWGRYP